MGEMENLIFCVISAAAEPHPVAVGQSRRRLRSFLSSSVRRPAVQSCNDKSKGFSRDGKTERREEGMAAAAADSAVSNRRPKDPGWQLNSIKKGPKPRALFLLNQD